MTGVGGGDSIFSKAAQQFSVGCRLSDAPSMGTDHLNHAPRVIPLIDMHEFAIITLVPNWLTLLTVTHRSKEADHRATSTLGERACLKKP